MTETNRLAFIDVPVGGYFTTTIDGHGQLCLKTDAGEVVVVSDAPPYVAPQELGDVRVMPIATPRFRPQSNGIEDKTQPLKLGDIALCAGDRSQQRMALCAKRPGTPPELFIDLATGETMTSPELEGSILSVWSKWEAIGKDQDIICRYPPRRLTPKPPSR